jgi:hypothetical protein
MEWLKDLINFLCRPAILFTCVAVGLLATLRVGVLWTRRAFALGFTGFLVLFIWSMTDSNFWAIVAKPDNVPISGLLILMMFFVWLSMHQAHENDRRVAGGGGPAEAGEGKDRILVWPDLVYT